jgi:hypothetical protein
MYRSRYFLVAVVLAVAPALAAGVILVTGASASTCNDIAPDNDVEYAGDVDAWCVAIPSPRPTISPTPQTTPSPTASPTPTPSPVAGQFPVAYFAPDFKGPATRTFSQQFISQVAGYIDVTYPAGSSSPSSGSPGGAQAQLAIAAGPVVDATLTYQIRFPAGFQWVKGGKLPGLCGGQCWTGSSNGPGGWTTRYMWRAGGAAEVLLSDATTTGYGTDLGLGRWVFQADGKWHALSQHIHLNTPGLADGYIDVQYNGVTVAHFTGITFRTASATLIDSLMFSTFYGGHDSTWAPTANEHIDFASFHVTH